ncbi:MAG: ATP-binding protein [bacterium]|nr:ATP-binding protein [bacterium]
MFRKRRFLWQIYPVFLLIIIPCLFLVVWFATRTLKQLYLSEISSALEAEARLAAMSLEKSLLTGESSGVEAICREMGKETQTRITAILPSGVVIGDSDEDPALMGNHSDRPEVRSAMAGQTGVFIRRSTTLKKEMINVAIPVRKGETIVGVIRAAAPLISVSQMLRSVYWKIALLGLGIALLAAIVSLILLARVNRPLTEIERGAERFARGELGYRLHQTGPEEIANLSKTMNRMAGELEERLTTTSAQREELETILSAMVEGVFVTDPAGRITRLNLSAARILGVDPRKAEGKNLEEAVRNPEIQRLVAETLSRRKPAEGEVVLLNGGERFLAVQAVPLPAREKEPGGALVVLHDITRLKLLERVRQDFVANVTHEVKTPITSIQGFVETLRGEVGPEETKRFLEIIAGETERLKAIIDDLLALSRIEKEEGKGEIQFQAVPVLDILKSAQKACATLARERTILVELEGDPGLSAHLSPDLLEQAVVNLIDNAIKYSETGSKVRLELSREGDELLIRVRDSGIGIPAEHLPRIFERFYRVDKSRSRKLGGTGLGLSIVKHIVQVHGGRLSVDSTPGKGSTFTIFLPAI